MSELFPDEVYGRKLCQAYVALALAQDVARRYVNQSAHNDLRPLLTILGVTEALLGEVLQNAMSEELPTRSLSMPCSDLPM